jgi:DNA-binding transcriptional MerR regulator
MAFIQLDLFGNQVAVVSSSKKVEHNEEQLNKQEQSALENNEKTSINSSDNSFNSSINTVQESDSNQYNAQPLNNENGNKEKKLSTEESSNTFIYSDQSIRVKIKAKQPAIIETDKPTETAEEKESQINQLQSPVKKKRKTKKELEEERKLIKLPDDDTLKQRLYHSIGEVAKMFHVTTAQIRILENKFDILKPKKNINSVSLYRFEDIKNVELILHLLKDRKFSTEGAKEYLKSNKQKADVHFELTQTLLKFRSFLLEMKSNLVL